MNNRAAFSISLPPAARAMALLIVLALPLPSYARPLYAARTGMACARCHVDPAGGGMRSGTGFRYALNGHTASPAEEREAKIDPRISDGLRLGADFRTQVLQDIDNEERDRSTFFVMQATLSAAATLADRLTLVYANDQGSTLEAYGLLGGLPWGSSLKVGRFVPAFGIEEEDHTTFTRAGLGLSPHPADSGIEWILPSTTAYLNVALTNGREATGPFDANPQKALTVRALRMNERFGLGASGMLDKPDEEGFGGGAERHFAYGAFGHVHQGPLVLMGEYDRARAELDSGGRADGRSEIEAQAFFVEAYYEFLEGRSLRAKYDRMDPDTDFAEDATDRITLGFETDVLPLARVLGFVRGTRQYGMADNGERRYGEHRDTIELIAQLHLGF